MSTTIIVFSQLLRLLLFHSLQFPFHVLVQVAERTVELMHDLGTCTHRYESGDREPDVLRPGHASGHYYNYCGCAAARRSATISFAFRCLNV